MNNLRAACKGRLQELLGRARFAVAPGPDLGWDLALALGTKPPRRLLVQVRATPTRHALLGLAALKRRTREPVMLFAPWIRDEMADELRKQGVFFADAAGNAWITWPKEPVLIDIRGRRPELRTGPEPGRLIEPTGLKVIHLLLTREDAINGPFRRLAAEAGVALGTVAVVMRQLLAAGYLHPAGRRLRRLDRTRDLFELFVRGYELKLRPECVIGRYRHAEANLDRLLDRLREKLHGFNWALTGAAAAKELTRHLEPQTIALYVDERAQGALRMERMIPDVHQGNVTLLRWFAPTVKDGTPAPGLPTATVPLVYAELLCDGRAREIETAGILLERYWKDGGRA